MTKFKYVKKRDLSNKKHPAWQASTHDVLYDRVTTELSGYRLISEQRSLEEQVKQCIEIMAELIEYLNIDASMFNEDYLKADRDD